MSSLAKERVHSIKVLLTSGYDAKPAAEYAAADSKLRVLSKPYKQVDFARALREVLRKLNTSLFGYSFSLAVEILLSPGGSICLLQRYLTLSFFRTRKYLLILLFSLIFDLISNSLKSLSINGIFSIQLARTRMSGLLH